MPVTDILLIGHEEEENLGMRSLFAFLAKEGLRVGIEPFESSDSKRRILRRILRERPRIIGYSISYQAMLPDFAALHEYFRSNGAKGHYTAGGHIPTIAPEVVFEAIPDLDTIIRHEGELTLLELLKNLDKPDLWPGIRGIVQWREGVVEAAPPRPLIEDLDALPVPARSEKLRTFRNIGIAPMLATRGCRYHCSFCSISQYYRDAVGNRHRHRSPANVVREMEQLFDRGVRIFIFNDDGLVTKSGPERRWVEQLAALLEKSGLGEKIIWSMFCRVDEVDADIIARLKRCGLRFICVGIESGNEQGLKTFRKGYSVRDVFAAVEMIKEQGLLLEYGFMMFDPESTFESIRDNLAFLERLCERGRVPVRFTKMVPLLATSITRRLTEEGRIQGTIAAPSFTYHDNRLDLLELFITRAFGATFARNGLVDILRSARKDAVVIDEFLSDKYESAAYSESIWNLTRSFNDSAFETLHKAVTFIEKRSYEDALFYWPMLDMLCEQERSFQDDILQQCRKMLPAELL